jgi:hypothetical protein
MNDSAALVVDQGRFQEIAIANIRAEQAVPGLTDSRGRPIDRRALLLARRR